MNIEALNQMIRVLESVKPYEFDLQNWHCGSYACAIGHACNDQWFIDRGLSLHSVYSEKYPVFKKSNAEQSSGWLAVGQFFDLNRNQAVYLFDVWSYPEKSLAKPSDVIERIKELIAKNQTV